MKPTKKSGFFRFIFAFCPGAAEMYMGFMKNGFSIMAVFAIICGMWAVTDLDFMAAIGALAWFFGFFHARNISKLEEADFLAYEDRYIWEEFDTTGVMNIPGEKLRVVAAVACILVGLGIIWSYVSSIVFKLIPGDYWDLLYPIISKIPSVVVAVALIVAGIILIRGKKKELMAPQNAIDVLATDAFIEQKDSKEA
ncbi:MAG: hypothetical protein K6G10_11780 [Butyrivibrio sp.]|nr:hypothetical protein [Butyrivibrio sp.]